MLYFIPAWYQTDSWSEQEQIWYNNLTHTEFDDTVKQVQLFHRNRIVPFEILLLSYAPNFRHFLHRQGVFRAPYWSCFDAIQEVTTQSMRVFSFYDLAWPEHVRFEYTPFAVVAFLEDKKFAQVDFGESGNPIRVDMFQENKLCRRNIYDDRGFLSSSIVFEGDSQKYQDFLTQTGERKLRLFFSDGHVEINPESNHYLISFGQMTEEHTFSSLEYAGVADLIQEVLENFLKRTGETDVFCEAMHRRHSDLLASLLAGRRNILSFYGERYDIPEDQKSRQLLQTAGYIVADSVATKEQLVNRLGGELAPIMDISPYDTREDVGISEQLTVQKVMVPIDGMPREQLLELVSILQHYMEDRPNVRMCLFTRESSFHNKQQLLELLEKFEKEDTSKFSVEQCITELEVSRCMQEQRLVVELRKKPELYLQVMCISIGLPQIVMTQTEFVFSGRNGRVIGQLDELADAMDHYLGNLKHWNFARMQAYEIGQQYATKVLVDKWKEVLRTLEQDTCITTG